MSVSPEGFKDGDLLPELVGHDDRGDPARRIAMTVTAIAESYRSRVTFEDDRSPFREGRSE